MGDPVPLAAGQSGAVRDFADLALKAYQGQMFKLPVIGDIAEQQAGK
jgi:uncharacterized membrane protein